VSYLYILILDESSDKTPTIHHATYRGLTKKINDPLELTLKQLEDISHILVLTINRKNLNTIREVREYLLNRVNDENVRKLIQELWIFTESIQCTNLHCCTIRTLSKIYRHLQKYENVRKLIVDLCHISDTFTLTGIIHAFEIISNITNVETTLLLLEYHKQEGHASIRELNLSKSDIDPLRKSAHLIDVVLSCEELSASDLHSISLLKGRFNELETYVRSGAIEHVARVLKDLKSQIELTLNRLRDYDVKTIIEMLPILSYLPSEESFINKIRSVIEFLLALKMYDRALKYLLLKIFLITLSHCCYFGIIDRSFCKFGNVEQLLREVMIEFLRRLDIDVVNRALHYVSTFDFLFIRKPFCRSLCTEELEKAGEVMCEGVFSEEELRNVIVELVSLVERLSYYELCDVLKDIIERRGVGTP